MVGDLGKLDDTSPAIATCCDDKESPMGLAQPWNVLKESVTKNAPAADVPETPPSAASSGLHENDDLNCLYREFDKGYSTKLKKIIT